MIKNKIKWINLFIFILMISCLSVFIFSLKNIIKWKIDSKNTDKQIDTVQQNIDIKEIKDNEKTEIIKQPVEISKSNPYWDYIKTNLINVDFNELKSTNSQVKGWIQVSGTNINYPFVQSTDNDYYLTHSFDKSYNEAGWVFIDYRNNVNSLDKNTIIYAHGRIDQTMFGSLKNILTNGWLKNTANYIVKLSTESENSLWQVFSVYRIPTTSDYIQISFNSNQTYQKFLDRLLKRSAYNFNTNINSTDNILTLSTCYDDYDKVVLHAKLIKKEKK